MIHQKLLFALIFTLSLLIKVDAQMYMISDQSTATVIGTSTLHDWESDVEDISGSAIIEGTGDRIEDISELDLQFVVKSIKSGKSRMDSYTYDALKADDHPKITYRFNKVENIDGKNVTISGRLNIAGHTNQVKVSGEVTFEGNKVRIKGKRSLDMTEFNIEPPTAMLGTIKVGKDIDLAFDILLIKK